MVYGTALKNNTLFFNLCAKNAMEMEFYVGVLYKNLIFEGRA